jgi:hypothetical protein
VFQTLAANAIAIPRATGTAIPRRCTGLWPSFVVAGIAQGIFFTLFDPTDLTLFDASIDASRTAVYSVGFFAFWALAAASTALTCFFQRTSTEINRPRPRPISTDFNRRSQPCSSTF